MTTSTLTTPTAASPARSFNPFRWSQRTGALASGTALTAMAVLSVFGYFIAVKGLWVAGDAQKTADAIGSSPTLWIAGVTAMFVVTILDVIAALGTSALFKPVHPRLAQVAWVMRTTFAAWYMVAVTQLVVAYTNLDRPEVALANIESFSSIWQASLGFFGLYLLVVAYLAIRSGFMPKIFGILIGIAGLGYIADIIGLTFVAGFAPTFGFFGFIGETAMIFWLLIKGRKLPRV